MYSPFTDGTCQGISSFSGGPAATTGHAEISGADPLALEVTCLGVFPASPLPYAGRYPCGSLVHDGVWYYGTYTLTDPSEPCGNWCTLGPFMGFRISYDYGRTWTASPHDPAAGGLFGEQGTLDGQKVKMGSPHFVDFGQNLEHAPDGKAYLVGHGAVRPEAGNSWISGDQVYLARVEPRPDTINDPAAYEFYAGRDARGQDIWTRDFAAIAPLFTWNDNAGCATITWNQPLGKYLMCVTWGWPTIGKFDTYLLEADRLTGPYRLITYMDNFGEQAYFVNIPSRFISPDGKRFWLCYGANWSAGHTPTPRQSGYALGLHEVELLDR